MAEAEGKTVPPTPIIPEGLPTPNVIEANGPNPIVAHTVASQLVVVPVTWAMAEAEGKTVPPTPITPPEGLPTPSVIVASGPTPSVRQATESQLV